MAFYLPEDWATVRQAVYDWARSVCPSAARVVWKKQLGLGASLTSSTAPYAGAPAPAKPYAALTVLSPPSMVGQPSQTTRGVSVVVTEALPDTAYVVTIDGDALTHTTAAEPAVPTANGIRDALVTAINGRAGAQTAFAPADGCLIIVTDDGEAVPTVEVGSGLALKVATVLIGQASMLVQVDVFADEPDQALTIAQAMALGLERPSVRDTLHASGLGLLTASDLRKPDRVAGSTWEDRAGFDVRFSCELRDVDITDFIDDAGTIAGTTT